METKSNSELEFGVSPYTPPWPEWTDAELNLEKWDFPKVPKITSRTEVEDTPLLSFVDPSGHCDIPPSVREIVDSYEHLDTDGIIVPKEGDSGRPFMDYDGASEAINRIVTAITILAKINSTPPIPIIEDTGNHYSALPTIWKPWHHVYSNCKAGKGQLHKPVMNLYGKYLVRLFYLGCWRRIIVDSFMPLEVDGSCVLPTSGSARWPQLLTKALLKIAALTWTPDDELFGWDPLICLTGWCPVSICCSLLSPMQLWKIFIKLLPNPEQDDKQQPELLVEDIRDLEMALTRLPQLRREPYFDYRVPTCPKNLLDPEAERMGPIALLVFLKNLDPILLLNVHVKRNPEYDMDRPPTPRWKRYRWKDWALKNGLIQEPAPPTIRLFMVYTPHTELLPEELNAVKVEPVNPRPAKTAKKVSKAASKSSLGTQVEGQEVILSFEAILRFIRDVNIFLRPTSFSKSIRVNNLSSVQTSPEEFFKDSNRGTVVSYTNVNIPMARSRAMSCFFVLFDSEFYKNLFVSVTSVSDKCLSKVEQNLMQSREKIELKSEPEYLPTLLAECYDWRNSFSGIPLSRVISSSVTPSVISLVPGMSVLRMWFSHPPRHFSILLASQTPFVIGGREVVVERMQQGSESLRNYESALTRAILNLVGKTPKSKEHLVALEAFHMSYLPPNVKTLGDCLDTPLALLLKSKLPSAFSAATRILGDDILTGLSFILEIASLLTDVEFELSHLSSRMLTELPSGDSFCEILRTRISDAPAPQGDKKKGKTEGQTKSFITKFLEESGAGMFLLRHMLSNDNELLQLYPFKDDLNSTIYYEEFKGTYRADAYQKWAPLFRLPLNHCQFADQRPTCAIHTMVSIAGWDVRVTDTTTLCDITNFGREPRPFIFKQGDNYSVLCYVVIGSVRARDIQWNLRISGLDKFSTPHYCATPEKGACKSLGPKSLTVKELVDYYIPNSKNIIGRTVVTYCERIVLSLRFIMSCPSVNFVVKVLIADGDTREFCGKGELILPYLELDYEYNNNMEIEKEMYMEILMVGDCWELNNFEKAALKTVIEKARTRRLVFSGSAEIIPRVDSRSSPNIRMERKSRIAFRAVYPDEPVENAASWSISIAVDSALSQNVKLDLDRRQEEQHRNLKVSWESESPGRFKSGQKLRQQFFQLMSIETHKIYKRQPPMFSFNVGEEKTVKVLDEKEVLLQISKIRWVEKLFYEDHAKRRISCTEIMMEQTSDLLKVETYLDNLIEITKIDLMEVYASRFEAINGVIAYIQDNKVN